VVVVSIVFQPSVPAVLPINEIQRDHQKFHQFPPATPIISSETFARTTEEKSHINPHVLKLIIANCPSPAYLGLLLFDPFTHGSFLRNHIHTMDGSQMLVQVILPAEVLGAAGCLAGEPDWSTR